MDPVQVQPFQPSTSSPLDQYGKVLSIKGLMQGQQLQEQELISAKRQNEQAQALNSAYHDAISMDASGQPKIDTGKLSQALAANGHGAAVPGILKSVQDYQKSAADLQEAKGKIQNQASEAMGFLGSAIQKAQYDPHLADLMIEQHLRSPNASPQEVQQLQEMRSQIQQNPQMLKTLADSYVAQAPKQQEFQNSKDVANIRSASEGKMQMAAWLRDNPKRADGTPTDPSDYQKFLVQQGIDATVSKETNPQVLAARKDLAVTTAQAEAPTKIAIAGQEASTRMAIEGRGKPVYAYQPGTGRTVLTDQTTALGDPKQYTAVRPVTEKEISDDRQLNNRLADVQQKIARYENTLQTDLSSDEKHVVAKALGSDKFKAEMFGAEIPVDWMNQLLKARNLNSLPEPVQQRVLAYRNAEEAMVGYQRVLSGSGRSSDKAMELNIATLPHPLADKGYANEGLSQFKENLKIAAQGLPTLPGVKSPDEVVKSMTKPAAQNAAPAANNGTAKKFLTRAAIQKAAKDNGISEIQAESQARAQGYEIQ